MRFFESSSSSSSRLRTPHDCLWKVEKWSSGSSGYWLWSPSFGCQGLGTPFDVVASSPAAAACFFPIGELLRRVLRIEAPAEALANWMNQSTNFCWKNQLVRTSAGC
jgi:hypothetical protein